MKRSTSIATLFSLVLGQILFLHANAQQFQTPPPILLGTSWYPEQWPESAWNKDLDQMQAAGMHVVRIGEFSWSTLEPREGQFEFGWLDRAIEAAARHNIFVVLGTPTAAPPAWLTAKYPDVLRVEEDGHRTEHGNRMQYSATNSRYLVFCADVARRMAQRYGHNPDVLGWQIDNEIGPMSFDSSAKIRWHAWLRKRYGSVDTLNQRWATAYWSQSYSSFEQVPMHSKNENPALLLDFKRFTTDTFIAYVQNQMRTMRPSLDPKQFITINSMHWFSGYDHYQMYKGLDLASWDDYVPDGHLDPMLNAIQHDLVRGYKRRNFWLMETQPGYVNWGPINATLPPGVTREMAWQAVAHGADAVMYWQWRPSANGQEQYHGSVLGADDEPYPIYSEIQQVGQDFAKAGPSVLGTSPQSSVAILQDYPSHWAIDFQRHQQQFDYTRVLTDWYTAAQPLSSNTDVVSADAPLEGYKVVLAPVLNVLTQATAEKLKAYVEGGGTLVLGPRSGMKDGDDALWPQRQPGPLETLLGAKVEQFYALDTPHDPEPLVHGELGDGSVSIWAETLIPLDPSVRVLLRYESKDPVNGWLNGRTACVERKVGKGRVLYIGALVDRTLMGNMLRKLFRESGVEPLIDNLPPQVELHDRVAADGRDVWIVLNHDVHRHQVNLPHSMFNVLESSETSVLKLEPHGVAVLETKR